MNNLDNKEPILGHNIKYYRKLKGLTQGQFASLLGLSRSKIASYELGNSEPNINNLKSIANCLSVTVDDLINGTQASQVDNSNYTSLKSISKEHQRIQRIANSYKELIEIRRLNGKKETSPLLTDLFNLLDDLTESE